MADPSPADVGDFVRNNRYLLFAGMGFAGGALGALAAETVGGKKAATVIVMALDVALWASVFSAFLCAGLFWAVSIYSRKPGVPWESLAKAAISGAIAGALAGGVAQLVFSIPMESLELRQLFLKPMCWGLAGGLIGWRLSKVIPNLGGRRGTLAGLVGGVVGGYGFIFSCALLPELMGRMLGVGIMGAALGLAIVVVELIFRKAVLEVEWGPKEVTSVSLGPQPVFIGGGDDHIHVGGLAQHAASITFKEGRIEYLDKATGQQTALKSGSRIMIGKVEIRVKAES